MATTRIWDIKGWIGDVVRYAENPEKTENPDYMTAVMEDAMRDGIERGLVDVLEYAAADNKTQMRYFVSGINCDPDIARQQMTMVKKQWHKESGIVAFHGYQSFKQGEVASEQAHRIGVELAQRLWGDRFQVVVATHLNTKCVHNHFVLNSVSFADGLKYYDNKENYRLMRRTSDEICREYGLSIIENPKNRRMHYAEWQAEQQGQRTWRTAIREDVDKAIMVSVTWSAFLRYLKDQGYEVKTGVKHMAIRPPGKERFVRVRSLGDSYTEEAIKQRILKQRTPSRPPRPEPTPVRKAKVYGDFKLSKITWKGLRALYFFYRRKLREAQHQPNGYAPHIIREDLRLMDKINEHTIFLFKHKIDTGEQLSDYRRHAEEQTALLLSRRRELANEKRRENTTPERNAEIHALMADISAELKTLRRDMRLCDEIVERSVQIAEKDKILKQEKEMMNNVPTGRSSRTGRQYGDKYYDQRR